MNYPIFTTKRADGASTIGWNLFQPSGTKPSLQCPLAKALLLSVDLGIPLLIGRATGCFITPNGVAAADI
ncbi:unnamed protein product [Calypogeia fissa]